MSLNHTHVLQDKNVHIYASVVNLAFSRFSTDFLTVPRLPAGQLDAESNLNGTLQPAGQAACSPGMDQQLSADVRLENKLSL